MYLSGAGPCGVHLCFLGRGWQVPGAVRMVKVAMMRRRRSENDELRSFILVCVRRGAKSEVRSDTCALLILVSNMITW